MENLLELKEFRGIQISIESLQKVTEVVKNHFELEFNVYIKLFTKNVQQVFTISEFQEETRLLKEQPKLLILIFENKEHSFNLRVSFYDSGLIKISGNFINPKDEVIVIKIWEEMISFEEEYPNYIKGIILSIIPAKILRLLISFLSIFLAVNIGYLLYTQNIGVDLSDATVIPDGNNRFKLIEEALYSNSTELKLNTLLKNELGNFTNASEVIDYHKQVILIITIVLILFIILSVIIIQLRKRFPRLYFNLNNLHIIKLDRYRKERNIIIVSVLVAFGINLISGLITALIV